MPDVAKLVVADGCGTDYVTNSNTGLANEIEKLR